MAQAVRNKYRMSKINSDIRKAMRPSNILVHGRSGSGKTELFRQIANIYSAPFIRVEATRFTEVGYHGEDVNDIIVQLYKKAYQEHEQRDEAKTMGRSQIVRDLVEEFLLKIICGDTQSSFFE